MKYLIKVGEDSYVSYVIGCLLKGKPSWICATESIFKYAIQFDDYDHAKAVADLLEQHSWKKTTICELTEVSIREVGNDIA